MLLASTGYFLGTKQSTAVANVAAAVTGHPVVTLTVGFLITLTFVALFAFMAFTLLLLPVALLGLAALLLTVGYGIVAWGHALGSRLPIRRPGPAAATGVVAVVAGLQLAGRIPLVGDLVAAAVVLTGWERRAHVLRSATNGTVAAVVADEDRTHRNKSPTSSRD